MAHDGDVERVATPAPVSRVSGRVRTLGGAGSSASPPAPVELLALHVPAIAKWLTVIGVVAGVVLAVLLDDARWGFLGGAALVGGIVLRRLAGQVSFSFGDGFLPYRADLGWPRGVQEDDDVHWTWADARRR